MRTLITLLVFSLFLGFSSCEKCYECRPTCFRCLSGGVLGPVICKHDYTDNGYQAKKDSCVFTPGEITSDDAAEDERTIEVCATSGAEADSKAADKEAQGYECTSPD